MRQRRQIDNSPSYNHNAKLDDATNQSKKNQSEEKKLSVGKKRKLDMQHFQCNSSIGIYLCVNINYCVQTLNFKHQ